jgi:tetratricopeptide (TPR) repeat protein
LESVRADGLRDSDTSVALAGIYWRENQELAVACAKEAAETAEAPPEVRTRAITLLVEADFQNRDFAAAAKRLEELVRYRRTADDWRLLGTCYLELGQPARALPVLQKAEAIRPYRSATHTALAKAYRQLGQPDRAREHTERGNLLLRWRQD